LVSALLRSRTEDHRFQIFDREIFSLNQIEQPDHGSQQTLDQFGISWFELGASEPFNQTYDTPQNSDS